ncbi:hypothetical protein [uncultured Mucilaginibacter sp.]|uniref:hypothetical protein n=1 Tax=uncultured Mucilaginibacter sp. TaxID=797541 RepID=UPI0025CE6C24|nr:hypothetical protein [uncultured Mucilaginibacter sp.]
MEKVLFYTPPILIGIWHLYNAWLYDELRRPGIVISDKFMSLGGVKEAIKKAKTTEFESKAMYLKSSYILFLTFFYLYIFSIFMYIVVGYLKLPYEPLPK